MKKSMYQGEEINPEDGLRIRESTSSKVRPNFTCVECGDAARVHKAGGKNPAHFEHISRGNMICSLVHKPS